MKSTGDLGPSLSYFVHQTLNLDAFLGGDGVVVQCGLQVLVVALAAPLGRPSKCLGHPYPVEGTIMCLDKLHQEGVFVIRPRASPVRSHVG